MKPPYYMLIDGDSAGPYTIEEMLSRGLDEKTLILDEDSNAWIPARTIPEIAKVLRHAPDTSRRFPTSSLAG
jgi:hypothetical protein